MVSENALIYFNPTDKPTNTAKWEKSDDEENFSNLEEFANFQIDLEKLSFHNLKPTMILETGDVERLGIHPKFFQIKSNFFYFCVAIDTSCLEEVCYF